MILWNAELTKRLSCSERERALLPSLIGGLLELGDSARTEGMKSIAQSGEPSRRPFLTYGLRLIAEGISTDALEEILAIYLATSTLSGYDFLSLCVCAEALLCLAAGDNRDIMLRKLAPYAGAQAATGLLDSLGSGSGL
jgi:hypothetical protein